MTEKYFEAVEVARKTGKIKKGINEVTKAVERGKAKLVVIAEDISPKEITMHLPILCKEKGITCGVVGSKEELGAAAGLPVGTGAVAVMTEGDAKDLIKEINVDNKPAKKEAVKPVKEEKAEETPKVEEKTEEKADDSKKSDDSKKE